MAEPRDPPAPAPDAEVGGLGFEGALEELEGVVERLDSGELSLEEALVGFERGVALSRRCAELLERAERRIDELVGDGEELRPFEADEERDAD